MVHQENPPDPNRIRTLDELAQALTRLRRRAAHPGQVQLSVRDLATRTGRAPSTLDPYLRGKRLCPADVYEDILRALEIPAEELRPWLNAWERVADTPAAREPVSTQRAKGNRLPYTEPLLSRVAVSGADPDVRLGVVCGDVRGVRFAEIWVNSENTDMRMARFEEHSMSAIIRFWGARHDDAGRVVEDRVADELERKVAGRRPVAAGTAITTSAGELARHNGVRYVIHLAAVQGEPGEGYRPVFDIGRCMMSALAEAERLATDHGVRTILFPLLGTGVAGGD